MTVVARPLVSIGVPTYRRADLLERALLDLVGQDHRPLEIVVSDNASGDATASVCARVDAGRGIVRHHLQPQTVPAALNFRRALELSQGDYFMWAADDDGWEPTFVSTLLSRFEVRPHLALVAAEARYRLTDGRPLPFFAEGAAWYEADDGDAAARLRRVVDHNYGNLIYGLYRRSALREGSRTVLDGWQSLNEIPVFLQVAARGGIEVVPDVLFHKTAPLATYLSAAHEYGVSPAPDEVPATDESAVPPEHGTPAGRLARRIKGTAEYHGAAWADCVRAVRGLPVSRTVRWRTAAHLTRRLAGHALVSAARPRQVVQ